MWLLENYLPFLFLQHLQSLISCKNNNISLFIQFIIWLFCNKHQWININHYHIFSMKAFKLLAWLSHKHEILRNFLCIILFSKVNRLYFFRTIINNRNKVKYITYLQWIINNIMYQFKHWQISCERIPIKRYFELFSNYVIRIFFKLCTSFLSIYLCN